MPFDGGLLTPNFVRVGESSDGLDRNRSTAATQRLPFLLPCLPSACTEWPSQASRQICRLALTIHHDRATSDTMKSSKELTAHQRRIVDDPAAYVYYFFPRTTVVAAGQARGQMRSSGLELLSHPNSASNLRGAHVAQDPRPLWAEGITPGQDTRRRIFAVNAAHSSGTLLLLTTKRNG